MYFVVHVDISSLFNFHFFKGYPSIDTLEKFPVSIRLALDVQGGSIQREDQQQDPGYGDDGFQSAHKYLRAVLGTIQWFTILRFVLVVKMEH